VQQVCDRVGIFVKGELLAEGTIDTLSNRIFAEKSYEVHVNLENAIDLPWKDEEEMLQLEAVQQVRVQEQLIEVISSKDLTPDIVRFFVHKGYDVSGVQKKEYGLEEIYERYFEKNLT
jgi:ABC-2 type transport system ATP-binding protein